jgi:hypothetical protein
VREHLLAMIDHRVSSLAQIPAVNDGSVGEAVTKEEHAYRVQMCTVRPLSQPSPQPSLRPPPSPPPSLLLPPSSFLVASPQTYRTGQAELVRALAASVRKALGMAAPELAPRRYLGLFGPRKPWSQHGERSRTE